MDRDTAEVPAIIEQLRQVLPAVPLLVLGVLAIYVMLPGQARQGIPRWVKGVLAALAGVSLAGGVMSFAGGSQGALLAASLVAVGGGIGVVTNRKPVYCALFFVLVVVAVAILLVLLQAVFLAAALLIIYAGAILVTYVFVIMLAQQTIDDAPGYDVEARTPLAGVLGGFVILTVITVRLFGSISPWQAESARAAVESPDEPPFGLIASVGTPLLTEYAVGVQVAGVLLLAAMIGALAIALRRVEADEDQAEELS